MNMFSLLILVSVSILFLSVVSENTMCYRFTWDYGRRSLGVNPITLNFEGVPFSSAVAFYAYQRPYGASANTGYEQTDTFLLLMTRDTQGRDGFVFVMDNPCNGDGTYCGFTPGAGDNPNPRRRDTTNCNTPCDPDGGSAGISMYLYKCNGFNCTEPYEKSGLYIALADDGGANKFHNITTSEGCFQRTKDCCRDLGGNLGDCYAWDECGGFGDLQWAWATCCTDGVAMAPLPGPDPWCMEITIYRAKLSQTQGSRFKFVNQRTTEGLEISDRSTIKNPTSGEVGGVIKVCGRSCEGYCESYTDCFQCVSDDRCGWCNDGSNGGAGQCLPSDEDATVPATCNEIDFDYSCCDSCSEHTECSSCLAEDGCGWCAETEQCTTGTSIGSCFGESNCTLYSTQDQCHFPDKGNALLRASSLSDTFLDETVLYYIRDFDAGDWTQFDDPTAQSSTRRGNWVVGAILKQTARTYAGISDAPGQLNDASRGTYYIYDKSALWSNVGVAMSLRSEERNYMGFVFRFIGPDDYYMFEWAEASDQCCRCDRRIRRIKKRSGGVTTVLAYDRIGYAIDFFYEIEVRIYDVIEGSSSFTQIDLWQDGKFAFSAKDTDDVANRPSYGSIGAYCADSQATFYDDIKIIPVYQELNVSTDNVFPDSVGWAYFRFDANAYNINLVYRVKLIFNSPSDVENVAFYLTRDTVATPDSTPLVSSYDTNAEYGFEVLSEANEPGNYYIAIPLNVKVDVEVRVDIPEVVEFPVSQEFPTESNFTSHFLKFFVPATTYSTIGIFVTPIDPSDTFIMYVLNDAIPYQGNLLFSTSVKNSEGKYFLEIPLPSPETEYFVTVKLASGTSSVVDMSILVQLPDPVLIALSKNKGLLTAGGEELVLTGSNFGTIGSVTIGGNDCTVTSWLWNQIKCSTPEGQGVNQQVIVFSGVSQSNILELDYGPPVISFLDPAAAGTEGGYLITISGTNFGLDGTVDIDNVGPCDTEDPQASWSHGVITCRFPVSNGVYSNIQVTVTTGGQLSFPRRFTYLPPTITALDPPSGPTQGNFELTLIGNSFSSTATVRLGASDLLFDNSCAVDSQRSNFTHIFCTAQQGEGAGLLVIVSVGNRDSTNTSSIRFSYDRPQTIAIEPANGDIEGGYQFHLTGNSFGVAPGVKFGDTSVTSFVSRNHTDIIGFVPPGSGLNRVVRVSVASQTSTTPEVLFDYNGPSITTISPVNGSTVGGFTVTINGKNFGTAGTVSVNRVQASVITKTNTRMTFILPEGSGLDRSVTVTAFSLTSNSASFNYLPPQIITLESGTGPKSTAGGEPILITGLNFGPTSATILFGDQLCDERVSAHRHDAIQCTLPAGQGTVSVTVTVGGQVSQPFSFTYDPPSISGISTGQNGNTAGGTVVGIVGNNFGAFGTVTIGGQVCDQGARVWSSSKIECELPAGQGTGVEVVVTVSGESDTASIYNYGRPRIDLINPNSVSTATAIPSEITVTGANFGDGSQITVTFDGSDIASTDITYISHEQIVFTLPYGTGVSKSVSITVSSQLSTCNIFFGCTLSYAPPQIVSVQGCEGGNPAAVNCTTSASPITIVGTSFGDIPDTSDITVTVGVLSCTIISIAFNSIDDSLHDLICSLPQNDFGGFDLDVTVTVDGQSDTKPYLSYEGPVIRSNSLQLCSGGATTLMDTGGQQEVCFDIDGISGVIASEVSVVYGDVSFTNAPNGHWYNCSNVVLTDPQIRCTTSVGIGENLKFRVTVRSQVSQLGTDVLSYATPAFVSPSIRNTAGGTKETSYTSRTSNGEFIFFDMSDLEISSVPQLWSFLDITYGSQTPKEYQCTQISVLDDSAVVRCLTERGSGGNLKFEMTALNVLVAESVFQFSYPQVPQISSVTGCTVSGNAVINCPTSGGTRLTVTGANFCDFSDPSCTVYVQVGLEECTDPLFISQTQFTCTLAESTGISLPIFIRETIVNDGILESVPVDLISYSRASITKVSGCTDSATSTAQCSRSISTTITLEGTSFGVDDAIVLIGGYACQDVTHDPVTPHTRLTCTAAPGGDQDQSVILLQSSGTIGSQFGLLSYALCPSGTVSSADGIDLGCTQCPQGQFSAIDGATSCLQCQPGTFSNASGLSACFACAAGSQSGIEASECIDCVPGTFSSEDASGTCEECSPGRYQPDFQSTSCLICRAGNYSSISGASECSQCEAGEKSSIDGAVTCDTCESGRFSPAKSSVQCTRCAVGKYSASSASLCTECTAGKAQSATGQSQCLPCDAGQYSSSDSASSCSVCTAGTFSIVDPNGRTECEECPLGRFAQLAKSPSCDICPPGTFTDSTGSSTCTLCPSGKANALSEQSQCSSCLQSAGEFAQGTANLFCSQCPAGTFSPSDEATACTDCEAGRFQVEQGASQCTECAMGRAVGTAGQTFCPQCDPGKVSNSTSGTVCFQCPAGSFQSEDSFGCQLCPTGRFSFAPGAESCIECAEGRFSSVEGSTECDLCPRGKISSETGQDTCTNCTAGTFAAEEGLNLCLPCGLGAISMTGSSGCTECSAGKYQNTERASSCKSCVAGEFSAFPGLAACEECPLGTFSNTSDATVCVSCVTGRYQNQRRQTTCKLCDSGRFAASAGSPDCTDCPNGRFAGSQGVSQCSQCVEGKFARTKAIACSDCGLGRYNPARGQSTCTQCEQGKFGNQTAATECFTCGIGEFTNTLSASLCEQCPIGRASSLEGAATCSICETGTFANETGLVSCIPCSEGDFADGEESETCEPCTAGSYTENIAESICSSCPPGTFNEVDGSSSCAKCAAGSFQSDFAATDCELCDIGTAVDVEGATVCPLCAIGSVSNETGMANCVQCLPGSFAGDTGLTQCSMCEPGTAQPAIGQGSCTNCTQGFYSNETGLSDCNPCDPGTFADTPGSLACALCPRGRAFDEPGAEECDECVAGRFQPEEGQSECLRCDSGRFQNEAAQESCKECLVGRFSRETGARTCEPCPRGTFTNSTGQIECEPCRAGSFQASLGEIECESCPSGRFGDTIGLEECILCAPGTAHNSTGLEVCPGCPGGRFQELEGQLSCEECAEGTFAAIGQSECSICAEGQVAPDPGTSQCLRCGLDSTNNDDFTECVCQRGFFADTRITVPLQKGLVQCVRCPSGAKCDTLGVTWDTLETQEGWWRETVNSTTFYRCQLAAHCKGGRNSQCGSNREGTLCAICEEDYQVFGVECRPCAQRGASIAISVLLILLIVSILCLMYYLLLKMDRQLLRKLKRKMEAREFDEFEDEYYLHADEVMQEATIDGAPPKPPNFVFKMKILLGFFQIVVGIAFAIQIPWPDSYKEFISIFNVANFDLVQWTRFGCVVSVDYYDKHLAVTVLPIVAFAGIIAFYLIPKYYHYRSASTRGNAEERRRLDLKFKRGMRKFWKMFLFTLFLIYPSVSSIVMRLYDCKKVEGVYYLSSDFTITCDTDKWRTRALINIVFVIIYPVGIPAFFFYLLYRNCNKLKTPEVMVALGFLYGAFELDTWWFELVDMSHKLFLTSVLTFFAAAQQLPAAMAALVGHLVMIHLVRPYSRKGDDRLHMLVQIELFLMVLAAFVYDTQETFDAAIDRILTVLFIFMTLVVVLFFVFQVYKIVIKFFRIKKTDETNVIGKIPTAAEMIRKSMAEGTQIVRNPAWLGREEEIVLEEKDVGPVVEVEFDQGSKMMVPLEDQEEEETRERAVIRRTFAPKAPEPKKMDE